MGKVTKAGRIAIIITLVIFSLWTLVPIWLVVSNSMKTAIEIKQTPPKLFFIPTLRNYEKAFMTGDFGRYFMNSLFVASATTLISVVCGAMAAYGLAIMKSRFGKIASSFMLLGKLVPSITVLLPLYVILNKINLRNSYVGPVLAHCSVNLPFVAWMMLSFMRGIPKEIYESGSIDGASRMGIFWRIIIPILLPAIGSAFILSMQYSWNELLFSLQLTGMDSYTLPVGIAKFVGAVSVDWGKSSAAATVVMVPIILVGFIMQKYLVAGLTAGAVKG